MPEQPRNSPTPPRRDASREADAGVSNSASPEGTREPVGAVAADGPADRSGRWVRSGASAATVVVAVVAVFFALDAAQDVLVPVALAGLLYLVMLPALRALSRLKLPRTLGAFLIVFGLVASCAGGFYFLSEAAASWLDRMPQIMYEIESKLSVIKEPMEKVKKASDDIEKVAEVDNGPADDTKVVVQEPGLLDRLLSGLRDVGIQAGIIVVLLYFLLTSGDVFQEKLIKATRTRADRRRVLTVWRQVERDVSTYLFTIAFINLGLGTAVALAMFLLGMPNPVLWGAMAAFLNFIPYLGALVGIGVISLVALVSFATLEQAILAPVIYLALTVVEAQFITPTVLGRRLTLNPVVIFIVLILWGWLWGIAGTLIAVPLLVTAKVICENVDGWQAASELISGRRG